MQVALSIAHVADLVGRHSVSVDDAARLLAVCRRTVYARMDTGRLAWIRVGSSRRILVASLLDDGVRIRLT
jgi:excisionase family DNA binding protein